MASVRAKPQALNGAPVMALNATLDATEVVALDLDFAWDLLRRAAERRALVVRPGSGSADCRLARCRRSRHCHSRPALQQTHPPRPLFPRLPDCRQSRAHPRRPPLRYPPYLPPPTQTTAHRTAKTRDCRSAGGARKRPQRRRRAVRQCLLSCSRRAESCRRARNSPRPRLTVSKNIAFGFMGQAPRVS